jgi:hypothetical protein
MPVNSFSVIMLNVKRCEFDSPGLQVGVKFWLLVFDVVDSTKKDQN